MINLYQTCYDLINQYIFNNTLVAGTYPELVTILFAVTACFLLLALPFVVVFLTLKLIMGVK